MVRTLSLALVLLPAASAAHAQSMPASLVGTWKIKRILPTHNVQCWDNERAKTLLGTTLRYEPHKLVWHGGPYPIAEALRRSVSAQKLQEESRVDFPELGLHGASVQEIDLQHEDADITGATTEVPGDTILLAGPRRIVVSACGVYYEAVKAAR